MSTRPAEDEFEEGEVPDDDPEPERFPKTESSHPLPDPEPSSSEIVFQTVTDHSLHLEKKKKKIHKEQKEKKAPSATREKDKNKEKDMKDRIVKPTRVLQKQTLPQAASPYPHPIYQAPYYPSQVHYYPPPVYPYPGILPPAMPPSYSYPPQHYYPPVARGTYGIVTLPPQPVRTQIQTMGPPLGSIQSIPMINEQSKLMQGRAPPGTFVRQARSALEVTDKQEEAQDYAKNTGTVTTQQQQRTNLKGNADGPEKTKQDSRRRGGKEELKTIIRKQLKGFNAQEQLNLLEIFRCLLKYHERLDLEASIPSKADGSPAKTAYFRSLDMLQSLSEQSDERKHTLNKLLETLGMDAIICTINERKLYEIAKNSEQFRKITEKGKDLRRDPFQSLLS